ncbi:bifunctional diaminohydroxyphosphoribosylaminopyrimidine deaminase/5-amino-6-(5-phosphoribosylamino)uracil reductase RibD [Nitrosomonadaceae bacterium]|nr:bifunctional diaminohydroxyphosphoribosylaminopyrimidine deaminase/5-amino-6-(5-phosphoribosylamino)uracil reductase RibD [Nitrosomonadaceae bacterium]
MFSSDDHAYMSQALQLAEKGLYSTSPNPRVGCVIVRDGKIVGSGWHVKTGQPHAEINALNIAGGAAQGATVYLTLEPCSHYGRTHPCAEALIRAKVAKVIIAMQDPNPLVAGKGTSLLKQSGINVLVGLMGEWAKDLNVGFVSRMTNNRPWVRMKIAASLDGKTALNNGVSQWITGEAARHDGHRLRARSCAVLTGIGTVLEDDPQLSVRFIETPRQPLRIIIDSRLKIPTTARVLRGEGELIFTTTDNKERISALKEVGARPIILPNEKGKIDLAGLMQILADFEINELLVEAGNRLSSAFIREGLVDELIIYLAPHLIGNRAMGMLQLPELTDLSEKYNLKIKDLRMVGEDIRIMSRFL